MCGRLPSLCGFVQDEGVIEPGAVRYTTVGDAMVAYQVTGDGPIDIVYMLGVASNFERWWDFPPFARVLERLTTYGRLILFDRRGSGISDPVPDGRLATWEQYTEDIDAVLDAAGSSQAAIIAAFDGGPVALVYAATRPERVRAVVLWNSYARFTWAPDYEIGTPPEATAAMNEALREIWGTEDLTKLLLPDLAADKEVVRWHTRLLRGAVTPASYARQVDEMTNLDARPFLPLIDAPVMFMNSIEHPLVPADAGRYAAELAKNGQFFGVEGGSLDVYAASNQAEIEDKIEEFITGVAPAKPTERTLASVLFTDIVGSTELAAKLGDARWKDMLEHHDLVTKRAVDAWDGRIVKTTGDGVLATFDGPGRAIRSALEMIEGLRRHGIEIRSGIHFAEIELRRDGDVGGIGVHVAARAMGLAGAGEVLCTRTVKDLSLGSDIRFEDRGAHTLKGVPDTWDLFAVVS